MAEERVQRRLAAILAADVVGYSKMMGQDEAGTLARLKALRSEFLHPKIAEYGGRIVKTTGDGTLIEFGSAVDAVSHAVNVQRGLAERNAKLPEDRQIHLRLGINVGDIIIDGDDIYGDGVNVAARLEPLADPGGICVSARVHDYVGDRLDLSFDDLGRQSMKNIAEPVQVYRILLAGNPPTSAAESPRSLPLPEKPSIAVLPFENMSGDAEQEYFADGIAEDIITALSRFRWFFVIARNSSFTYKGAAVDVTQVARELGVHYVLEGSVRKAASRVRITAQLIDATNGRHVWAERFDRDLQDIFAVQDEITSAITAAVGPEFVSAEAQRTERKSPESFDSWDYAMRGNFHLWRISWDDVELAKGLFQTAIELDPKSTLALTGLALAYTWQSVFGWTEDLAQVRERAFELAQRAVASDPRDAWAHAISGYIHTLRRQSEAAIRSLNRALELNPNLAFAEGILGLAYTHKGDSDNSLRHVANADRLSPRDPARIVWRMAYSWCAFITGDYERAVQYSRQNIEENPSYPTPWRHLAASLGQLGRLDEARAAVAELLRLVPGTTVDHTVRRAPISHPGHLERFAEGLRKAGLPE